MKNYASRGRLLVLLCVLSLLAIGCVSRMLDFTVISSKNVEMKIRDTAKGPRVTGEDMAMAILGIPLGTPNLKEAIDRAIESAGPGYDALIDGVVYRLYNFYLIVSRAGYKVQGTPIKTSEIIAWAEREGENVSKISEKILFHSSFGADNKVAIEKIGISEAKGKE